jgi:hypothetical protein
MVECTVMAGGAIRGPGVPGYRGIGVVPGDETGLAVQVRDLSAQDQGQVGIPRLEDGELDAR